MSLAQLPTPNGQVLSLVSALSNTSDHELHLKAIRARDEILSSSPESYGGLCVQLGYLLVWSDQPRELLQRLPSDQMEIWKQNDMSTALRLQQDESMWTPFGQMAGLVLKNALLHPPILMNTNHNNNHSNHINSSSSESANYGRPISVVSPAADDLKAVLLFCLGCQHAELRAVASTILATSSVSPDGVQPALHIRTWPQLIPNLISNLQQQQQSSSPGNHHVPPVVEGSLSTIRKMMEDGPTELDQEQLDALVPLLLRFLASDDERSKVSALQSLVSCHNDAMMPSSLVLHFSDYLASLSALANDPSPTVRKWVCRSIVTLLELRTEFVQPHMEAICQFMLKTTSDITHDTVALEACEFWLAFASLDDEACTPDMVDGVGALMPQLVPILLRNMVYLPEQQIELQARNELDQQEITATGATMRPVFHRSRNKHGGADHDGAGADDDDDDDDDGFGDDDDDDGNEWTLRKCAAASLDSLANVYGAAVIMPPLLPSLQEGLSNSDPWVQEASILALGAIAEGCHEEMNEHMAYLHPYLMTHLAAPETPTNLAQLKSIAAWTIGRYAGWAVEQVQTGAQGHLLAHITEVFLERFKDQNRRVQVACCSAFGVIIEAAGDLMAPYLEPIYQALVLALSRYQGRSLVIVFDTLGIMADFIGPAIAEGTLPGICVPHLMRMWDGLAKNDPTDRTLLPLMESVASMAQTCGVNFQPYALETFNMSMCMIESVMLLLASDTNGETAGPSEEDVEPIVCATDVLDGLVEGLGASFTELVVSSQRYGPSFASMLHSLIRHEIPGVRMSALALLGDVARNAPSLIENALPQLLQETIMQIDPIQPSVCNNAVWAVGKVCVKCGENASPIEPYAASLLHNLMALLVGNGIPTDSSQGDDNIMIGIGQKGGVNIPGLAENAAAAVGRLAKVNPNFVAPDLPKFLLGWCDGMAKITDPTERRDAYEGFIKAVYANPQSIQQASLRIENTIASILFAVVSWHMPSPTITTLGIGADLVSSSSSSSSSPFEREMTDLLTNGDHYTFQPFPQPEAELGNALARLLTEIKTSIGEDSWSKIQKQLPVNMRRLLREAYHL